MLLAYDSNSLTDDFNVDDQLGDNIDIPTIILTKDVSDIIRDHLLTQNTDLIMSIFFSGNTKKNIEMTLFYRSDDLKVFSFFREFNTYRKNFGDKLTLEPVFKYTLIPSLDYSNTLNENLNEPCIKNARFCSSENPALGINNGRKVIFENLRQSCIYKIYGIDVFWEYMIEFGDKCVDPMNPLFNEECSILSLKKVLGSGKDFSLTKCLEEMVNERSKVEEDYHQFNRKRIYRVPTLLINGAKYKGNWLGKSMFTSICNGFIEDNSVCSKMTPTEITESRKKSVSIIVLVTIIIIILMVLLLVCYRRYVNKSLEISLSEKIQEQALKRISQYQAFKDEGGTNISDFFKKTSSSSKVPASNKLELEEP